MQTRRLKILQISVAITVLMLGAGGAWADWTFAMLGDTRGERETTQTGVSVYLNTIASKIATLKPDLVLVSGDLVNGNDVPPDSNLQDYAIQFNNWKTAMQPVYNYSTGKGISIYPVRGNHENSDHEGPTVNHLKEAYYNAFKDYLPFNGPVNSSTDDQRVFSYSLTHNNVTFAVADQYFYYNQTDLPGYHKLDSNWVVQQFAQTSSPYKVFMAHEPIFNSESNTPGGFFGDDAAGLQTRADFWNQLGDNGVQLYLTGHLHNETVAGTTTADGNTIIQLMAGNGGASMDAIGSGHEPGVDLLYANDTNYGFALATVGDNSMTIEYYLLNTAENSWTTASYSTTILPVPEPSTLLLLAAGMLRLARRRRRAVSAMKAGQYKERE